MCVTANSSSGDDTGMNTHYRFPGLLATLGLLAGCSGAQTAFEPPAAVPPGSANSAATAQSETLVYIGSVTGCRNLVQGPPCQGTVSVYSYPTGRLRGQWSSNATAGRGASSTVGGECTDAAGDVFVTRTVVTSQGTAGSIVEFAHGGTTPIKTLNDPSGTPSACSIDATTGDLAVINSDSTANSSLFILHAASANRTTFAEPGITFAGLGYDDRGNLFADGSGKDGVRLVELTKGAEFLKNVELRQTIVNPGSVQFDGKYVAVTDTGADRIYRIAVNAGTGTVADIVHFEEFTGRLRQTWIQGDVVFGTWIGPDVCIGMTCPGTVSLWRYPAGGRSYDTIGGPDNFGLPSGVALSAP